jgi:hypothetical protein
MFYCFVACVVIYCIVLQSIMYVYTVHIHCKYTSGLLFENDLYRQNATNACYPYEKTQRQPHPRSQRKVRNCTYTQYIHCNYIYTVHTFASTYIQYIQWRSYREFRGSGCPRPVGSGGPVRATRPERTLQKKKKKKRLKK